MSEYLSALDTIVKNVISKNAPEVDRSGAFPTRSVDALAQAGLLGLTSAKGDGGLGESLRAAATVVEQVAAECGSTAMILCMHYAGAAVLEKYGSEAVRREVAAGKHLSTLAFSERGSRSQFWAPLSTAEAADGGFRLAARKSWVTSANHATAYVWSSRPSGADGLSSLWLVSSGSPGIEIGGEFDGLGLRGNDSTPVTASGVPVTADNRLGADGEGLSIMLETVLPTFNVLTAATAVGLMRGAIRASASHAAETRFEHSGSTLADLPTLRAHLATMQIAADSAACLLDDTLSAIESGRDDAQLRVLESKAAAGEAAARVTDLAMRVCGGAAFSREVGIERRFRDARACLVMAPTSDQLHDFIGKALCGMPVF